MSTLINTISSKTSQFSKNAKTATTGMVQDMKIIWKTPLRAIKVK